MKPYKLSDKIIKTIHKEFEKALKTYNNATEAFKFNYTPKAPGTAKKIKIYCLPTAWCKMTTLVQKTSTEIAWHMLVEKTNKTTYIITDVLVYPQTVSGATVNTDDTKYALWVSEQPDETFNKMRGQGHSHVSMGVSPSLVDTTYYNDLLSTMQKGFYMFMILNKSEKMFLQLVDLDANIVYETSDIVFEIATKQWSQDKWYTEAMKNIRKNVWSRSSNAQATHSTYAGAQQTLDGFYGEEDNWYDRFK